MASNDLNHYAVQYKLPDGGIPQCPALSLDALNGLGIKYIRILWVDLSNTIKCRIIPLAYYEKLLRTSRPGSSVPKAALGIVFLCLPDGFSATGEYLYALDLSTLRICPYAPGHANVLGWFEEKQPQPHLEGRRALEVDLCPRTILRRTVDTAKLAGVEFLVGFETEFVLLSKTSPIRVPNHHPWCSAAALPSGAVETKVLEEIVESLTASGVEVQMYHSEAAPGQYEVITGPLPPLQAVDALIHTRTTIFNVASKHGLRATLAPRVFTESCGTAAHTHISVHSTNKNIPSSIHPNLSKVESAFLAGLLQNISGITLLALPTTASFRRMVDGVWSGGTYVCWGTDNREAPVRLCNASSLPARNFEVKCLDGTANPYLAIAAFLSAGTEGILDGRECEIKDCGLEAAALLGEPGRKELGIANRMPLTWEDARSSFEKSELIDRQFGKDFKAKYLSVNKTVEDQMNVDIEKKWVENW